MNQIPESLAFLKKKLEARSSSKFLIDACSGTTRTYGELHNRASRIGALLRQHGVQRGDRIAVIANNSISLVDVYFACLFAGVSVVPISPTLLPRQVCAQLTDSRAKIIVLSGDQLPRLAEYRAGNQNMSALVVGDDEEDIIKGYADSVLLNNEILESCGSLIPYDGVSDTDEICLVYTSGTLSTPKGVIHRLSSLVDNARAFAEMHDLDSGARFYNSLPLTYLGGYYNLTLIPYIVGASVVIDRPFSAQSMIDFWRPIIEHQVNTLWIVPTIASMLLEVDRSNQGAEYCRRAVRKAFIGTAALPSELKDRFESKYGIQLLENYGLAETLFVSTATASDQIKDCGVGHFLPQVNVRIVNKLGELQAQGTEGEIEVKTPYLMIGYDTGQRSQPRQNLIDGWFQTGDLGVLSSDNALRITGRKKDLIIRGGINISPVAIENVIYEEPDVLECAVVGMADKIMGEEIAAVVRLAQGANFAAVENRIRLLCQNNLAPNQQPKVILELPQFPRTASGKVQKIKLRRWVEDQSRFPGNDVAKVKPEKILRPDFFRASNIARSSNQATSIKYNNQVYELKRKGIDVTVLSLGEAFFDIPLRSFDDLPFPDLYHYSHSRGVPELRENLARYFLEQYDVAFDHSSEIIVTAGSKIAIHMALMAVLNPGDEVLIHEPAWVSYPEQVKLCYGVPVQVPYYAGVYDFESYISNRTKVIIINNPNNPTGKVYSLDELSYLYHLAEKYNLYILSDEAYSDFLLDGERFVSIGNLDRDKKHLILCNSISKNYGMSGWRLGYVISNSRLISEILKINQHLITCPATILEHYITKHFFDIIKITKPQIHEVVRKRRQVLEYIDKLGLSCLPGTATFYAFLSIAPSKLSSEEFCTRLLNESYVCVVPGIGYGRSCDGFVRVSVGTESLERIKAGLERVKDLIDRTSTRRERESRFRSYINSDCEPNQPRPDEDNISAGCNALLKMCADLKVTERVLILSDPENSALAACVAKYATDITEFVKFEVIRAPKVHGEEPDSSIADLMLQTDVVLCLTKNSLAHTSARFAATKKGVRFLSLPDYSWDVLTGRALLTNFRSISGLAQVLADMLTRGSTLRLTTGAGTDLVIDISGRTGNAAPGWCQEPGTLASPPDAESNIAPKENGSNGILIVDGSIPCKEIGLLEAPIRLQVQDGMVSRIVGNKAELLTQILNQGQNWRNRTLAEFGIGLNPHAQLSGNMLEDEGALGTVHIGLGSNKTIGGLNDANLHLDLVVRDASVQIDDIWVMRDGRIADELARLGGFTQ